MTRILLVCPEPLGHGQPAGIGIRFIEMARTLLADGHQLTVLSADGGEAPGCRADPITPENLARWSSESDVAIIQGHAANDFYAHGNDIPSVVDLYDPFIIENFHYYSGRGAEVFGHDHATLMASLLKGDLFLCASQPQRLFYLGILLALGRLNPAAFENDPRLSRLIRLAPFGVQPARTHVAPAAPDVLFGGIYDWYDPILAIDAVAIARRSEPRITLTFTRHPNPEITPQGKTADAIRYVKRKGYDQFIRFQPWFAYDRRGEFFDQFSVALLTFAQSLETELSMRTRIYDYLWGGLPVVSSSAPGTDDLLTRYGAGISLLGEDAGGYAAALLEALGSREQLAQGSMKFVSEHQWNETLEPLREFCRAPQHDPFKQVFVRPAEVVGPSATMLDRLKRRMGGRL